MYLLNNVMKLILLLLIFVYLFSGCDVLDPGEINNLFAGYVHIIGHGGSGFPSSHNPYPPNSMLSLSRALDGWGADGIEVDIQMSSDSTIILFHDASMESSSSCAGFIQDFTYAQLSDCHYRSNRYDERIISLEAVLDRYKEYASELFLFLDVKLYSHQSQNYDDILTRVLNRITVGYPQFGGHIVVISGSSDFLKMLKELNSRLLLMFKTEDFADGYFICSTLNLDGLVISHKRITRAQVVRAHGLNLYIMLTEISSRNDAISALKKNPDFVQTDNIPLIQKILY